MPTIDELASQVAALEQQMAAITTPPDKYYTSIYSGEEIDAAITKVRSGAMGVSSFNGRAGAVMPQAGDYNAAQIPVSADTGAETVAAALANKANRNLLDNWYFPMAVNQRGDTSWTNGGYHLDRWFIEADADGAIDSDGFHIGSGATVIQKRPLEEANNLLGKTVTVSCLLSDGSFGFATGDIPNEIPAESTGVSANIKGGVSFGVALFGNAKSYQFGRISNNSGSEIVVVACKTEFGPQQTLAHQDEDGNWVLNEIPDYGAELAKCQRYLIPMDANSCWGFAESNTSAYLYLPLPVSMRTTPVFQGNLPPTLWPGGNSVTSISVFSPSAIESMIALHVVGTGFIAQNCYSLNQPIGFLSAEL